MLIAQKAVSGAQEITQKVAYIIASFHPGLESPYSFYCKFHPIASLDPSLPPTSFSILNNLSQERLILLLQHSCPISNHQQLCWGREVYGSNTIPSTLRRTCENTSQQSCPILLPFYALLRINRFHFDRKASSHHSRGRHSPILNNSNMVRYSAGIEEESICRCRLSGGRTSID